MAMGINPYRGVNAHLNSVLQSGQGRWEPFHNDFIGVLVDLLDPDVRAPYYIAREKSLQISVPYTNGGSNPSRTKPDLMIYRAGTGTSSAPTAVLEAPTEVIDVVATLEEEDHPAAAVIYKISDSGYPGTPITRFELLSPGNKPPGAHHSQYVVKRRETLYAGLRLVEIDLLHESRPAVPRILSYPDREPNASAYTLLVSDPRPNVETGKTAIYSVHVNAPLPRVRVPLDGEDSIIVDFNAAYHLLLERRRLFREVLVDYTHEPLNMQTYTNADQAAIRAIIAQING
jgi:hypothetical protein